MKINLKLQLQIMIIIIIQFLFLFYVANYLNKIAFYTVLCFCCVDIAILIWIFVTTKVFEPSIATAKLEESELAHILEFGEFSMLEYDDNYNVLATTGVLKKRHEFLNTKKLQQISDKFSDLLHDGIARIVVKIDENIYEVELLQKHILLFRSIDEITTLQKFKDENNLVLGLFQIDNYNETLHYEEERKMAEISTSIRKMINDWAFKNNLLIRRLRQDCYLIITKNSDLDKTKIEIEQFLKEFKKLGLELDTNISASIVFSTGSFDYNVLDEKVNELLELAQARGGDQAIIHDINKEIEYYGGNSESVASKSKVRIRAIMQSIEEAILESSNVLIVGHKIMDFDCMGSSIAMSKLAYSLGKKAYIVSESGGIEEKLENVLKEYNNNLIKTHTFITDEEAVELHDDNSLVIVVDHHNTGQSNAPKLIKIAKNIIVIDHHRRGEAFIKNPILVYLDSSASSVCELIVELFKQHLQKVDLTEEEATLMYTGILVDTNHFSMRTSTHTFEAAAYLKTFGIDLTRVNESLNEDMHDFTLKTQIGATAYQFGDCMIAAFKEDKIVSRSILSQVADHLLSIQGIDASFVIGYSNINQVAVSARSNKNINVQTIMEKMQGGGHFTAAAMQRMDVLVEDIENELKEILKERLEIE